MKIDPLSTKPAIAALTPKAGAVPAASGANSPSPAVDKVDSTMLDLVQGLSKEGPLVRPEMVERGRQLIKDPGYPPDPVVDSVARSILELFQETEGPAPRS